jgi:hypothetical protein
MEVARMLKRLRSPFNYDFALALLTMRFPWLVLALYIVLGGCGAVATMRYTTDDTGSVGPRGGVIEYRDSGIWGLIGTGRSNALSRIRSYCEPEAFEIVDSRGRAEITSQGNSRTIIALHFQCVPQASAPALANRVATPRLAQQVQALLVRRNITYDQFKAHVEPLNRIPIDPEKERVLVNYIANQSRDGAELSWYLASLPREELIRISALPLEQFMLELVRMEGQLPTP